jgi:hypothetical protein
MRLASRETVIARHTVAASRRLTGFACERDLEHHPGDPE